MIQRIQTVYMFVACAVCVICLCSEVGRFMSEGAQVAGFSNFTFTPAENFSAASSAGPWALSVLLIMSALLNLFAIMLFRKRLRQLRIVIFSSIFLVGYILVYAVFAYVFYSKMQLAGAEDLSFVPAVATCNPIIALILNYLAIHAIRKDEALVRSLDRIR